MSEYFEITNLETVEDVYRDLGNPFEISNWILWQTKAMRILAKAIIDLKANDVEKD